MAFSLFTARLLERDKRFFAFCCCRTILLIFVICFLCSLTIKYSESKCSTHRIFLFGTGFLLCESNSVDFVPLYETSLISKYTKDREKR